MLKKIVDGKWKDSEDRKIDFTEWDELTIRQLLDFLYFGHYHVSVPVMRQPGPDKDIDVDLTDGMANCNVNGAHQTTPVCTSEQLDSARPTHKVNEMGVSTDHKPLVTATISPEPEQLATIRAFTLLQHSKLYVLAHYLELTDLKDEAYEHIRAMLELFLELSPKLLDYVVQLIRHVYASTDTLTNSKEPLRELIATFVAEWFHDFQGDGVKKLMEKGGDFVVDVMEKVQQRALDVKKQHEYAEKELQQQIGKYQKRLRKKGSKVDGTGSGGAGQTG